jgi:hypothetical protein
MKDSIDIFVSSSIMSQTMFDGKHHTGTAYRIIHGYGSIPINTIFRGMNIHLPAILMFTRVQGFDTLPHVQSDFEDIAKFS